jgi:chemotaxis protein methyltransferase CheR
MTDSEQAQLLEGLYEKYGYDFRQYSHASMNRRIHQAMIFLRHDRIQSLQERALSDSSHFFELLQFLTVSVSEMFRDPMYYKSLRENVFPILSTYPSLKVWIAGCSTGEEVYSLAILLKEEGLLERTIIYATDINSLNLEKAEAGVFKLSDVQKFTMSYHRSGGKAEFSDYYTAGEDAVIFDKSFRKNITFSDHSLSTDMVFSETHFISCRNVMIYFDKELQNRALELFHESLCRKGFLGLGSKETVSFSTCASSFDVIDKKNRIYRKNDKAPGPFNE